MGACAAKTPIAPQVLTPAMALHAAVAAGNGPAATAVLSKCPSRHVHDNFVLACAQGKCDVVGALLGCAAVNPMHNNHEALKAACMRSREAVVRRLLQDVRVNPGAAIVLACGTSSVAVIQLILSNARLEISSHKLARMRRALATRDAAVRRALLPLCDWPMALRCVR